MKGGGIGYVREASPPFNSPNLGVVMREFKEATSSEIQSYEEFKKANSPKVQSYREFKRGASPSFIINSPSCKEYISLN